mgnify:CR=1 FL=1
MQISKREFLKKLGAGSLGLATGAALADEYVPDRSKLPAGSCGDPQNVWFGRHIFPVKESDRLVDGESCRLVGGKVIQPQSEIEIFHSVFSFINRVCPLISHIIISSKNY